MNNFLEKSMNLGLGIFIYSREKIEEIVEDLVNKGDISRKDARQFAGDLLKRGQEQRDELKRIIKDEVADILNKVNFTKKDEYVSRDEISQIVKEQVIVVLREQGLIKSDAQN